MTPRLQMEDVRKAFGATRALNGVSLSVAPGEVHALIGGNGAGKSTLMKVLSGVYPGDSGSLCLDGEFFHPQDPLHARRCGIAMIYQELNLAPHLSVEENILLGKEPSTLGWIHAGQRRELARRALGELHHENIPLRAALGTLTIAEQQVVEIARALVEQPKVLIMDEPTSSLTQVDAENLFRVIDRLRQGGVSVVYSNHLMALQAPREFFPLPPGVWVAIALAVLMTLVLRKTVFGRYVFAIGSNEATARLCGIRVPLQKILIYGLAGLFFGLAGLMQMSRLNMGDPSVAVGLELDVIAAVVIGGASLSGGSGSISGSMIGALIMAVLRNGSGQMGWEVYTQEIIIGAVITAAVAVDCLRHRRSD